MRMNRRNFLEGAGATALTTTALGTGLASSLIASSAHGADVSGYKALVCVFLFGGMDGYDFLIPYDQASYTTYSASRGPLITAHGGSRDRTNLLQLSPDNASSLGGAQFALPSNMPGLHGLFQSGDAAIVGNVGPLIEPVTREQVMSGSGRLPPKLFSHNDQQSTWQASAPEGATFGWGGRFADAMLASGANNSADGAVFTTLTSGGNQLFLSGQNSKPYEVSPDGVARLEILDRLNAERPDPNGEAIFTAIRAYMRGDRFSSRNMIGRDITAAAQSSLDSNERFRANRAGFDPLVTQFPQTDLGEQLRAVAEAIAIRGNLGVNRQIFFVGIGGFDTHGNQALILPGLQMQIDGALTAFNAAMTELGASNDVTLFTASDFGRTLAVNGDGTDHGWGGHQVVMGGAVQGRQIFGPIPPPEFGHAWDVGGGRLLPSFSVEQFAEPIGRWFGLTQAELQGALPNLANFSANAISTLF